MNKSRSDSLHLMTSAMATSQTIEQKCHPSWFDEAYAHCSRSSLCRGWTTGALVHLTVTDYCHESSNSYYLRSFFCLFLVT